MCNLCYSNRCSSPVYHLDEDTADFICAPQIDTFENFKAVIIRFVDEMSLPERLQLKKLLLDMQNSRKAMGFSCFRRKDVSYLKLQSAEVEAGADITDNSHNPVQGNDEQEVIVRYLDENPGTSVQHNKILDSSFHGDFVEDHSLSQFLSRPQLISTITWAEGAYLTTTLEPWDLFFNSTQNKKKLDNYGRISCNLHMKLLLNASPFYYGAGIASYQPVPAFNNDSISTVLNPSGDAHTAGLSQKPHIWFYPQTNQGGEITAPFLYYKNWLDITVRQDVRDMGKLFIFSPTTLQNANSVVGAGVTIQIYAWATDVKLCAPTASLALQSGEYGVVSGPASAVANIAKKLSGIPMIAPYARATDMIASGIGSLAKLFGFTNVPVIEDVKPLKNVPFHAFSSCEISQPIEKLTLDPKNELSIDSRVCGHDGVDELLLSNFIQRESYVVQAIWASTHVTGQVLIRSNVCPDLQAVENHTANYVQGTPMSHAAALFRFWRGDIIYRFRFICSKFHRGRVLIQWDPATQLTAAQPTNLIHSQIVDLSTETDVEFRVPFLGLNPFLRNQKAPNDATSWDKSNLVATGAVNTFNKKIHNGSVLLSVLTQQTSPVSSADVQILVSVRAADNMTFGMPQAPPSLVSFFDLQSEESEEFDYDNTQSFGLTKKGPVLDDNTFAVNMGERITSLRQVLRRVQLHRSWATSPAPSTTLYNYHSTVHAPLPLHFGYDPNGIHSALSSILPVTPVPFNYVFNTHIGWITNCFVGYRGGINWHYNFDDSIPSHSLRAYRWNTTQTSSDYGASFSPSLVAPLQSNWSRSTLVARREGLNGSALTNQRTQSGWSVYYPMYSQMRFKTVQPSTIVLGTAIDESDTDRCRAEISIQPHSTSNTGVAATDLYVGIGTDFTCIFFINVPTYIVYGTLPTAL